MNRPATLATTTAALLWLAVVLALAGCNTVAGFGEDIETAGDRLEESAEDNKTY